MTILTPEDHATWCDACDTYHAPPKRFPDCFGRAKAWLILRVFAGRPLHVEHTLRELGINAYCPAQTIKRRHPRGKEIITQRKPLLPGYVFSQTHFDVDRINTTRVKARWLTFAGRLATLNEDGIAALRASESQWQAVEEIAELAIALGKIARGVPPRKHRFVKLADFQQELVA